MLNSFKVFFLAFLCVALLFPSLSFAETEVLVRRKLMVGFEGTYTPFSYNQLDDKKIDALRLNDVETMFVIGCMYRDGRIVRRDYRQAKEWYEKAAELNHPPSQVELAKIYSYGEKRVGIPEDLAKSEKLLNKAATSKSGKALYLIGLMYERGVFVKQSYSQAVRFFEMAGEKGFNRAFVKVFLAYQFGKGITKNEAKALGWLRVLKKTTKNQQTKEYIMKILSDRYFILTEMLPANASKQKFLLYNLAWDNGKAKAADMVAESLAKGYGVGRDCDAAKKWYEMSVEQFESVQAMERLGSMLIDADCGNYKRDFSTAAQLFERAANVGGSYGAYMVGFMKKNGMGVPKNTQEATVWFERSEKLKKSPRPVLDKRRKFTPEEDIK